MGLQFAPASPSDQPATLKFLNDVFQAEPGNSFRSDVWQWKYFSAHPGWNGTRSFVLRKDQEIIAHGGVWPIRLAVPGGELKAIHLIDWAASKSTLGAGIHILKNIATMADIMLTVGGTQDTRKILPKIGYQNGGVLKRYARVVRPWLQLRTRPHHDWKTPLRFLRNAASCTKPLPRIPPGWQVSKVSRFDSSIEPIFEGQNPALPVRPLRTAPGLNHTLDCPGAEFSGFIVSEPTRLFGYFVLARIGRQVRIVHLQINGQDPGSSGAGRSAGRSADRSEDWRLICGIAARTAWQDPQVCELVVGTPASNLGEIFEQLGFRLRRQDPILYYDPRKLLSPATPLNLNLIDTDLSFLCDPGHPYIT